MGLHPAQLGYSVCRMQAAAERIKDLMTSLGISVSSLADQTAIPRMTLTRRLADPANLTLAEIDRIATALETTSLYLTTGLASAEVVTTSEGAA